jgi:hypothetical protein
VTSWNVSSTRLLYTDRGAVRTGALVRDDVAPVASQRTEEHAIDGGINATVTANRKDVTAGYLDTSAGASTPRSGVRGVTATATTSPATAPYST